MGKFNVNYGELTLSALPEMQDRFGHGLEKVVDAFTDERILAGASRPLKAEVVLKCSLVCDPATGDVDLFIDSSVKVPGRTQTKRPLLVRNGQLYVEEDDSASQLALVDFAPHPNLRRIDDDLENAP